MRRLRAIALTAALIGAVRTGPPHEGAAQTMPESHSWTVSNRDAANRYEGLYGPPEFWTLSLLVGPDARHDVPSRRSIRTIGRLYVQERPREVPVVDLCLDDTNDCLALNMPAREISDAFFDQASFRRDEVAEVVGVFGADDEAVGPVPGLGNPAPPAPQQSAVGGFLFWSFSSAPAHERRARDKTVTLEDLVIDPGGYEGRTVVVRGAFRGRNLFGDMRPETARDRSDWVLNDGPFFIWVTGHAPEGDGFALDLDDPGAAAYRLEVEGEPEGQGGLVYLRAREVRLLGRAREPGH